MHRGIALVTLVASACHVRVSTETTRPGTTEKIVHTDGAIARTPTLVLTDAGTLRFIEPLACPTEHIVTATTAIETSTQPNLATFIVGVIATSVGGVMTVRAVTDDDAGRNPLTYAGLGALGVGLPLAFGPWIGHTTSIRPGPEAPPVRQPGPSEPCGERGLSARHATLTVRDVEVFGAVDKDGVFGVSPYALVDAFDTTAVAPWDVKAHVEAAGGARTIEVVIEGGALAQRAPAFLARAGFDARVQPLRLVPGLAPGRLRASLTSTSAGPALRVVVPLHNDGPGEAWAVRGHLTSPTKAVDGRVIYIGHLAKGEAVTRELLIPLSSAAADALRGSEIDLSVELRDAHGTAPSTPMRFRGAVLGDASR